jgi:hypothetical protein
MPPSKRQRRTLWQKAKQWNQPQSLGLLKVLVNQINRRNGCVNTLFSKKRKNNPHV